MSKTREITEIRIPIKISTSWMRVIGIFLFAYLLYRFNIREILSILFTAEWGKISIAFTLIVPLIALKTIRWQILMHSQSLKLRFMPALLAYFASLFIGFLTPGRLGEFSKTVYAAREMGVTFGRAFSSVLFDRFFDLILLLFVGSVILSSISLSAWQKFLMYSWIFVLVAFLILVFHPVSVNIINHVQYRLLSLEVRNASIIKFLICLLKDLQKLTWRTIIIAILFTLFSYLIYFSQGFILALSLNMQVGFLQIIFAVTLGSLVTLLPISISGLGTREAVIVWYLGAFNISPEVALSFSLLIFTIFFLGGGLMGFLAWLIKPLDFSINTSTTTRS